MNTRVLLTLAVLVLAGMAGLAYHLHHRATSFGPPYHVRTEFEFTVHAPYSVAAPLFGPERERAGHRTPGIRILYIHSPQRTSRVLCSRSATDTIAAPG